MSNPSGEQWARGGVGRSRPGEDSPHRFQSPAPASWASAALARGSAGYRQAAPVHGAGRVPAISARSGGQAIRRRGLPASRGHGGCRALTAATPRMAIGTGNSDDSSIIECDVKPWAVSLSESLDSLPTAAVNRGTKAGRPRTYSRNVAKASTRSQGCDRSNAKSCWSTSRRWSARTSSARPGSSSALSGGMRGCDCQRRPMEPPGRPPTRRTSKTDANSPPTAARLVRRASHGPSGRQPPRRLQELGLRGRCRLLL